MPFYLPILPGPYGKDTDKSEVWITETPVSMLSRAEVVNDIASGQIDPPPVRVLEIDEANGTVKDVTAFIADEVGELSWQKVREPFPDLANWLDSHNAPYLKLKVRA